MRQMHINRNPEHLCITKMDQSLELLLQVLKIIPR